MGDCNVLWKLRQSRTELGQPNSISASINKSPSTFPICWPIWDHRESTSCGGDAGHTRGGAHVSPSCSGSLTSALEPLLSTSAANSSVTMLL